MNRPCLTLIAVATACVGSLSTGADGHGFAGDRFFPATILTDDPFVADEMSLPTVTFNPSANDGSKYFRLGAEAIIPVNSRAGHGIGAVVQLHCFLDDSFPHTFGKPLLGD